MKVVFRDIFYARYLIEIEFDGGKACRHPIEQKTFHGTDAGAGEFSLKE